MNPSQPFQPWVAPLGWLALETSLVVLAALALQPLLRTAAARRSLWRAALLALLTVLAAELSGAGSQLPAQLRTAWQTTFPAPVPPIPPPIAIPPTEPPDSPPITYHPFPIPSAEAPVPLSFTPEPLAPPPPLALSHPPTISPAPLFLWLAGLAALLARSAFTHVGFAWLRLRHFIPAAEALRDRVQNLAARLGLRRRVRVLASERLRAPAAFGWVRPGVGVPGDFTVRFAPAQQDVMLAHELAHLAARDPLWQLLADLAAAALWWHPLAWVARRQHRLTGELAADDASQALPDGPVVLAECLLALGQEAAAAPRAALGMAGFRSQLGRRVERLVALPRADWQSPSHLRLALQTITALLALAALALLPGCAANRAANEAPTSLLAQWWQAKSKPASSEQQTTASPRPVAPAPTNTEPVTIQGRVSFNGTPPPEHDIPLPPSALVARTNAPLKTRLHRVSPDGGLADVVVYVKAGLEGQSFPPTTNTQVIRVMGFEFWPYIAAVEVGQPIRWENHQSETFNLNPTPTNLPSRQFSRMLLPDRPIESVLLAPEEFVRVKTDVYPWMFHYVSAFEHPYFAVTDTEGRFRFPQPLPPGKYTLAAHHRRAGERTQEIDLTVPSPAGQPVPSIEFRFPGQPGAATSSLRSGPVTFTTPPPSAADFTPAKPSTREELLERKARVEAQIKQAEKLYIPSHPKLLGLRKQLETVEEALRQTPPVGDDVRSLTPPQTPAAKPQTPPASQRLVTSSPTNASPLHHQPTVEKLARIRIPEVTYDELPLPEVLKLLEADAKRYDPAKQRVSFGMRVVQDVTVFEGEELGAKEISIPARNPDITKAQSVGSGTVGVSLTATVPLPRSRVRQVAINDMDQVLVHVPSVLRDVSVLDALDAIVRTTDAAIGYTVETNHVVIHPRLLGRNFTGPRVGMSASGAIARAKAEKIILPQLRYDSLILPEVVSLLAASARNHDPDKRGLNFLYSSHFPDVTPAQALQPPALDPQGNPIPGLANTWRQRPDLDTAIVYMSGELRGLTLAQMLDAICKTAEVRWPDGRSAGLNYTYHDFGVLFTARHGRPLPETGPEARGAAAALRARLDRIVLPRVSIEKLSLQVILERLTQAAREHDPERRGVNLLATPHFPDPPPDWVPKNVGPDGWLMAHLPAQAELAPNLDPIGPRDPPELQELEMSLPQPLIGRTLAQVLEAVCQASPYPITYRVESYGVLLVPDFTRNPVARPQPLRPAAKPGASAPAPSPFAERGEKVAEGRLRGAATNADAANPSPQPSPLSAKRERESESASASAPAGDDVRSLTSPQPPDAKPQPPPTSQRLVTSSPTAGKPVAATSAGAGRILRKLDQIVVPEVHFDGVPLVGVVQRLIEDAKQFDPEKQGLNFLINDVAPAAPLLDAAGNPVPVARPVALSEGLIRVTQPLRNLTLRQALDVICKTAELPTQYSVEEYAIAFIPRGPVAYYSRIFRVNPNAFMQGLQGVVGNPAVGQPGPAASSAPGRATVPATVPATQRTPAEANALVRQFFQSAGVTSLGATNGSTRVFFNPANGLLTARGTTNDLRVIEQAIEKLQPTVPLPPNAPERDQPGRSSPASTNAAPRSALPNPIYKADNEGPFLNGRGAINTNRKLDEIILPEVRFDGVPLPQVVVWLDEHSKKHDPEKMGLNFLINNVATDYITAGPVTPTSGKNGNQAVNPPRPAKVATPNLDAALVKVTATLTNLTLRQALDVICKTAWVKPVEGRGQGLTYSVENYAIVFSPKGPEQAAQFSRMFKVNPEAFIVGLRTVAEEGWLRPGSRAALDQALREKAWTNAPAGTSSRVTVAGVRGSARSVGVVNTDGTDELNYLVRRYFTAAGVVNLGVTNGPDATQVFFNDRNGLLLVRASLQDLEIIQMAIELLNEKLPEVLVGTRTGGVNQNDNKALGYDWLVGTVVTKSESKPATNRVVVIDREGNYRLDGQARSFDQIVVALKQEFAANRNLTVHVRTPKGTRLDAAKEVLERCSRLGITNVTFATEANAEVERVPTRPPNEKP